MIFGTFPSIDSIRIFPRVGHGVGQAVNLQFCTIPLFQILADVFAESHRTGKQRIGI